MPTRVYTVEIDGHHVDVEANSPAEAMAAATHWADTRPASNVWQDQMTATGPHSARAPVHPAPAHAPTPQPNRGHIPSLNSLVGNTAMTAVTAAGQAGQSLVQRITGNHAPAPQRSQNPLVDALMGFPSGAGHSIANMATMATNPDAAFSDAGQQVARTVPVIDGAVRGRSGDEVAANVAAADAARREALGPSTGESNAALIEALGNRYQPSTAAGRFSERAGAATPFLAAPGAVLPTLLGFGAGEVAGGAAHLAGGNAEQADAARLVGNLAGSTMATGVVGARPSERVMSRATENMDMGQHRPRAGNVAAHTAPTTDLDLATALMRRSRDLPNEGIDVHGDEALSQVAGPRAGPLQTVVRQAGRTRSGGAAHAAQIADRPAQIRNATMGTADMIAPPVNDPAALAVQAQRGANDALGAERQSINAQARPHYDNLPGQQLPPQDFEALMANPSFRAAMDQVVRNPELAPLLQQGGANGQVPLNDLNTLNLVVQQLDTLEGNARESPLNPQGNNTVAGVRSSARDIANAMGRAASPDWAAARDVVSSGRQATLEPMIAGPLGDIAGSGRPAAAGVQAQSSALYPAAPPEGMPANTVAALQALEAQQPGVGASLTRSHLIDALEQGTRRVQGGDNPRGGANVANRIAGNRNAGNTYLAGVNEVAPGAVGSVDDLIQALQATGTRSPEGSATATDTTGMSDLGAGEIPLEAARAIAQPHQLPRRADDFLSRFQIDANSGEIMRVLGLGPDEFDAYMRQLPGAAGRGRIIGLAKALLAANQDTSNR